MKVNPNLRLRGAKSAAVAVLSLLVLLLGGCSQAGDPGAVTLKYLQARANADVEAIRSVSCAAWEGKAVAEADSFRSMNAKLDNVSCKQSGTDGDAALVTCSGQITTTYNGEDRGRPIPGYRLEQEDGEWKVCGES